MKKVIRLTESDLTRIVKRIIKENKEKTLQDLIEDAKDILENELEFSIDYIDEMNEFEIVDSLRDYGYDELVNEIEYLMEEEGFYNVDEDEPYDSIGGHSVNDIKKALKNIGVNVDMEQKMEDLFHKAYDVLEENGITQEESTMYSEEELIEVVSEFDQDLAEEMEYLLNQLG